MQRVRVVNLTISTPPPQRNDQFLPNVFTGSNAPYKTTYQVYTSWLLSFLIYDDFKVFPHGDDWFTPKTMSLFLSPSQIYIANFSSLAILIFKLSCKRPVGRTNRLKSKNSKVPYCIRQSVLNKVSSLGISFTEAPLMCENENRDIHSHQRTQYFNIFSRFSFCLKKSFIFGKPRAFWIV